MASLVPLGPVMDHVAACATDQFTLRAGTPTATADWQGGARVDGEAVTTTTTRYDPTIVIEGLAPRVEIRVADEFEDAVDRRIRRI